MTLEKRHFEAREHKWYSGLACRSSVDFKSALPTQSRQRSLQALDVNLVSFWHAKKSSPATLAPPVPLDMHHHTCRAQKKKKNTS